MKVYAWPPVAPSAWEWTVQDPIDVSRSLITGRRYASAAQRRRIVARLSVGGARGDYGGYMEALKRLLLGGAALVRLTERPMLFGRLPGRELRSAEIMRWTTGDETLGWTTGAEGLLWFTGRTVQAAIASVGVWPAAALSGLPPSTHVARVGETLAVHPNGAPSAASQHRMILRPVTSDAAGRAVAVLDEPLTASGRADIGPTRSAVFEAVSMPRAVRQPGAQYTYDWEFSEVFPDETNGFEELNPWG